MQRVLRVWAALGGCALAMAACGGGGTSTGADTSTSSAGGASTATASSTGSAGSASTSTASTSGTLGTGGATLDAGPQGGADGGEDAGDAGIDPCSSNGQPAPAGTPCDDGNPCNGAEACDGAGHCLMGTPPDLDDGDPCTLDACDPQLGITHAACSALDATVATTIASASSFLVAGPHPPQLGVVAGTIEPARAAIVRGHVATAIGAVFPGAAVSVLGHPEFGTTTTFADGVFTMLVNGGGPLTFTVTAPGLIPAQRTVDVPWNDYARAADVVLLPYDGAVTAVDLGSTTPVQIAQGSVSTDADGARRATLMFAAATAATLTLPGGTLQALTGAVHVRATEFTVGALGFAAMPGTLPPTSAYTYAVELSVDEAVAAGATRVDFDRPVAVYVDNFLGLPAGTVVPAGSYDPAAGAWVASTNGRVLEVVGESGGLVDLDLDGDGMADAPSVLADLGITDAERAELAILYAPGDSIWRVAVQHFTSWDMNLGYAPPDDGCAPFDPACSEGGAGGGGGSSSGSSGSGSSGSGAGSSSGGPGPDPIAGGPVADPCEQPGSVIECQNQILGESLPLAGTPFRLHYRSDRTPGRTAAYALTVPLSGAALPASLRRIDLTVDVAGRSFPSSLACPCSPHEVTTFTWDGHDVFGRLVQGAQPVTVTLGYVYDGVYADTPRFGMPGSGASVPASKTRREVVLKKVWTGTLGVVQDDRARRLGGWSLSPHDVYDPAAKIVYRGDGTRQQADAHGPAIRTLAGGNGFGFAGDGGPAVKAQLNWPSGIALAPDGTLFIADRMNSRVRKVDPNGTISLVTSGLFAPIDVKLGPEGSAYVAELGAHRIARIVPGGAVTVIAGGPQGFAGDGGPAALARLDGPMSLAVARDGMLYIADSNNRRVRAIGTDGTIMTIAGGGALTPIDGMPATQAYLGFVQTIALGLDGALFVAAGDGAGATRIYRVAVDGTLTIVAGTGEAGNEGDGGPARLATFGGIAALAVSNDGALYVVDTHTTMRVRRIAPDGTISAFAGVGQGAFANESGPPAASRFGSLSGIAVAPDGALLLSDQGGAARVFRIAPVLPGVPHAAQSFVIPSADGRRMSTFDGSGRHLQTLDARTGAALYTFGYDAAGRLASVADVAGLITTVVRDAAGNPTAIVAPYGQATVLALDAAGWLASVTDPAQAITQLGYDAGGLLTSRKDPKGQIHVFTYDTFGRLVKDADPAGGAKTLARTSAGAIDTVTVTTALGRTSTYVTSAPPLGGQDRAVTSPSGLTRAQHRGVAEDVVSTSPEGTTVTRVRAPDPRFGMAAPYTSSEVTSMPSGLTRTVTRKRSASLSDPADLMSFATLVETTAINGRTSTRTYAKAARTLTDTSPLGRVITTSFDTSGRITSVQRSGLLPLVYAYDTEGRLSTATRGARMWSTTYDPQTGEAASVHDPLLQVTSYLRDAVGRVTSTTRPDMASVATGYDASGNETTITPHGSPPHVMSYTPIDKLASYAPPAVSAASTTTTWAYDLDGAVSTITRPDGPPPGSARPGSPGPPSRIPSERASGASPLRPSWFRP